VEPQVIAVLLKASSCHHGCLKSLGTFPFYALGGLSQATVVASVHEVMPFCAESKAKPHIACKSQTVLSLPETAGEVPIQVVNT